MTCQNEWHRTFPQGRKCPECKSEPIEDADVQDVRDWANWVLTDTEEGLQEPGRDTIAEAFLCILDRLERQMAQQADEPTS